MKHPALAAFTPNSEGLLRKVSELVDDPMLEEIAQCDYGEEAAEHLIELRKIRDTGEVPVQVQFCPLEVLALTRWTSDTPTRTMGRRDHVMRAWAATGHALRALAAEAAIPSQLRDLIVYLGSLVAQNPAYWR